MNCSTRSKRLYSMNVFAIGDLHLSGFTPKPMNVFGGHWDDHWTKIKDSWYAHVGDNDVVLIPGDLSWAMRIDEAKVDIDAICAMPGSKVIMRGNHDYWWSSLSQVNEMLTGNAFALQNNSRAFGDIIIAGSRGWICPGNKQYNAETDEKLYVREAGRLELSLQHAKKTAPDSMLIGMMHYPPTDSNGSHTLFTDLFEQYGTAHVVYGHLHAASIQVALGGNVRGVNYKLVSCDATDFQLVRII